MEKLWKSYNDSGLLLMKLLLLGNDISLHDTIIDGYTWSLCQYYTRVYLDSTVANIIPQKRSQMEQGGTVKWHCSRMEDSVKSHFEMMLLLLLETKYILQKEIQYLVWKLLLFVLRHLALFFKPTEDILNLPAFFPNFLELWNFQKITSTL